MKRTILKIIIVLLSIALIAEVGFVYYQMKQSGESLELFFFQKETQTTEPENTELPTEESTEVPTEELTEAPTEEATEETQEETTEESFFTFAMPGEEDEETEEVPVEADAEATEETAAEAAEEAADTAETEPEETKPAAEKDPNVFDLTFVGDCTLGSSRDVYGSMYSFIWTIGEDYSYPFKNVRQYFEDDDFTFANLEGNLMDEPMYSSSQFSFRGPTAYTEILTGSSVEMVTLANNHTMDFGKKGYEITTKALDDAGIAYVENDSTKIFTTERGLKIGVYGASFITNASKIGERVRNLRKAGADIVVIAMHWGVEGAYRPNSESVKLAHTVIDAGADIIYGSHPHVLQPVEQYKDGVIYYSLSNFCFGGNHWPQDNDSVILKQQVVRQENGKFKLGELTMIPCSVSSITKTMQNNFQPTPYEEGSDAYNRCLSKLDGSWKGGNLTVSY